MNSEHSILEDDRDLEWVQETDILNEQLCPHMVGSEGVTRIACVPEPQEFCLVPTICIWRSETLWKRILWQGVHSVGYPCSPPLGATHSIIGRE